MKEIFKINILLLKRILTIIIIYYFNLMIISETKKSPKISLFIPIYNKKKYLIKCIKSIQNQSLKNIEILAINDYSTDDTLLLLKQIAKKDPRIKIINNDRNHGLLYSRAMGIINSTGEYLMNIDPDDELKGKDSLEILYKIAKKKKIDFISFAYKKKNKNYIKCSNYNTVLKQPKLFLSSLNSYNQIKDFLIWNKLIKREVFLKAYEIFKNQIYFEKWNYHEDNIWSILVYRYANSMICINKIKLSPFSSERNIIYKYKLQYIFY